MRDADEEVTRSIELDAPPESVWEVLSDPDARHAWLDDDDAAGRELRLERSEPGSTLSWTWWHHGDPGAASTVEIVLTELDSGGTRVAVTERLLAPPSLHSLQARASVATRARAWDLRLLGVELLLVAAGLCVG